MARRRRDYDKEYKEYQGLPAQKRRRAQRNKANRAAKRAGKIRKGDGKEVHHVGAPRTGSLAGTPTRVVSRSVNRRIQPDRPGGKRRRKRRQR